MILFFVCIKVWNKLLLRRIDDVIQVRSSVNPNLYPFVDLGGLVGGGKYVFLRREDMW